jgi:hypothetical protein
MRHVVAGGFVCCLPETLKLCYVVPVDEEWFVGSGVYGGSVRGCGCNRTGRRFPLRAPPSKKPPQRWVNRPLPLLHKHQQLALMPQLLQRS